MVESSVLFWGVSIAVQVFIIGIALFIVKKSVESHTRPSSIYTKYITHEDHDRECRKVQDTFRELLNMKMELMISRMDSMEKALNALYTEVKELRGDIGLIKMSLDGNAG